MTDSSLLDKIFQSVVAKIFLVVLQTVLVSLVLLMVFPTRQSGDITLLKYAVVLLVGLLAGYSARRFLKTNTQALKLLAALLSSALSLAFLYLISRGFLGINLFFGFNKYPDWPGLIQLVVAALGAWLVISAFRPAVGIKDIPVSAPSTHRSRPTIKSWPPKLRFPSGTKIKQKFSSLVSVKNKPLSVGKSAGIKNRNSRSKANSPTKISAAHKLSLAPAPRSKTKKPAKLKMNRARKMRPKDIKFIGIEEHVCPYCLDPVLAHDPRGVKICPDCKTHHHADCWGITGACQIPHSH